MNTDMKLAKLRELMKTNGIDVYHVGTDDFHLSEYVGEYFKCRKFLSGFTGSAGTIVVTETEARLWTDGRYFIQAAAQIEGSEVQLMKMGEKGVPTVTDYLKDTLKEGQCLGFDGRTVSLETGDGFAQALKDKNIKFVTDIDLVDQIWEDRPELSKEPAFMVKEEFTGKPAKDKIADLRKAIANEGCTGHVLTTLDDICWLLNIRGNDIDYNPLVLSYAFVSQERFVLFADKTKFDDEIMAEFAALDIQIMPYNHVYPFIKKLGADEVILISPEFTNYEIASILRRTCKVVTKVNPTTTAKAVKNPGEIKATKEIHLKDAVAMIKFIMWLEETVPTGTVTEVSAGKKLYEFRKEQGCFEESFATIVGYKEHGAICHYEATEETDKLIKPESLLLVDSGGHYMGGTTDITRTFVMGPVDDIVKRHYTAVLAGMLRLGRAVFPKNIVAATLDVIPRMPLWEMGLDYNHGTGHGVGHMLVVHEFPNNIKCYDMGYSVPFEPGMINSNEPGLYIEGEYGIRHENEMLCVESDRGEDLLEFEYLTFVPFDLKGIDLDYMTEEDKADLNRYHAAVYEKISPLLNEEEKAWLANATRPI